MKQYIDLDKLEKLISKCIDTGYSYYQIEEGCLGYGYIILVSPNENHWNFEIQEKYVNEQSSTHIFRRVRKLSKRQQQLVHNTSYSKE